MTNNGNDDPSPYATDDVQNGINDYQRELVALLYHIPGRQITIPLHQEPEDEQVLVILDDQCRGTRTYGVIPRWEAELGLAMSTVVHSSRNETGRTFDQLAADASENSRWIT